MAERKAKGQRIFVLLKAIPREHIYHVTFSQSEISGILGGKMHDELQKRGLIIRPQQGIDHLYKRKHAWTRERPLDRLTNRTRP